MHSASQQPNETLPGSVQAQIDGICDEFEAAVKATGSAAVESYLDRIDPQYRDQLRVELVRVDLAWKSRGTAPGSVPENDQALLPPDSLFIDRYRIINHVGSGNFGDVYRAFDTTESREVALKLMRERCHEAEHVERFRHEAQILAELRHDHIPLLYDFGCAEDRYYIAGQWINGQSLKELLAQKQRLNPRSAARIAYEISTALTAIHGKRLIHRDVKPANILLDKNEKAYLVDFGIALRGEEFTVRERFEGSPTYMSPEQAAGLAGTADGRSDLFSLGVVLYEMLTGSVPYRSKHLEELLREICHVSTPPPRQRCNDIPKGLEKICLRCLAKSPEGRYASASELSWALRKWLGMVSWLCAAAAVILAIGLAVLLWPSGLARTQPVPPSNRPTFTAHARQSEDSSWIELSELAPLRSGDQIRLMVNEPEGWHVALFWIDSEGNVRPRELVAEPGANGTRRLWDPGPDEIVPLVGPPGTEVLLVCATYGRSLPVDDIQRTIERGGVWPMIHGDVSIQFQETGVIAKPRLTPRGPGAAKKTLPPKDAQDRADTLRRELAPKVDLFLGLAFPHESGGGDPLPTGVPP